MDKGIRLMLVSVMLFAVVMVAAAPAFADKASQTWKCEIGDGVSEDELIVKGKAWVEAAKSVEGGKNIKAYLRFPVAVDATGEVDVVLEVIFPTFEEWGKFWDNYSGSEAANLDDMNQEVGIICPDSAVWEIDSLN